MSEAWRASWPALLRNAPATVFDATFTTLSRANPHMRWAMGIQHPHEFFKVFEPYTLWGLEDRFQCPVLMLFGEDEIAQTNETLIEETVRTTTWSASSTPRSGEYGHVRDPHSTTYSYRARLLRAALEA